MNLNNFEQKVYSQHGEDGATIKIVETIYKNLHNKYYVEFGADSGIECNTRILAEKFNWAGLLMDSGNENLDINLRREYITKENIIDLLKKYNVPYHINLLSVDIDYNDFYCAKEILKTHTCDILIFEYNASHLPNEDKIVIYNPSHVWDGSNYFGVSLLSWKKLANFYNYSLVYCDSTGTNCYFINNSLLKENYKEFDNIDNIDLLYRKPTYGNGPNGGHSQDLLNREYLDFKQAIEL